MKGPRAVGRPSEDVSIRGWCVVADGVDLDS